MKRPHYAWIILGMGVMVVFGCLGLGRFTYGTLLPSMQSGLNLTNAQAGGVATVGLVAYLLLAVVGGVLASRFGPRVVISAALVTCGIGMLLTALAQSFAFAAFAGFLMGTGSGAGNVAVMGLLSAWFGKRRRGLASGIAVSGSSVAIIVVGPIVPRILQAYEQDGWRVGWLLFGVVAAGLGMLAFVLLRNRPSEKDLEPYAASPDESASASVTGSGAAGLHWGGIYRSSAVWHLGLVYVAFGLSYIIFMTFFTKRLIADGHYSAEQAGNLFMLLGWFSLVSGIIWGTVSDVLGRKAALVIVYLIHAASFTSFALWGTPAGFTVATILFGLTAWSIPAIVSAACGGILGPRMAPAALGFVTLFFSVGQAVGPSIAGAMADASGSFSPAFLLAGGVALAGAAGASLLKLAPTAPEQGEERPAVPVESAPPG